MLLGTFVNAIAILVGSTLGIMFLRNIPEQIKAIVFQGLGLSLLLIGMRGALKVEEILTVILSLVLGGVVGELLNIDKKLESLSLVLKKRFKSNNDSFSIGFANSFILFCTGALGIVGSINQGIQGDYSLLFTKAIFDGFSSIALASVYGVGVLLSFIPLIIIQTILTLIAHYFSAAFSLFLINQLTAVGGLLIVGVGINILEIKKLKVVNFLPALLIVIILSIVFHK